MEICDVYMCETHNAAFPHEVGLGRQLLRLAGFTCTTVMEKDLVDKPLLFFSTGANFYSLHAEKCLIIVL